MAEQILINAPTKPDKYKVKEGGKIYEVIVHENGTKEWRLNGKLHREDGPAMEYTDGTKYWYLNGKEYTKAEFKAKRGKNKPTSSSLKTGLKNKYGNVITDKEKLAYIAEEGEDDPYVMWQIGNELGIKFKKKNKESYKYIFSEIERMGPKTIDKAYKIAIWDDEDEMDEGLKNLNKESKNMKLSHKLKEHLKQIIREEIKKLNKYVI